MIDALMDSLIDSIKLIPFLLITYLLMGALEHATSGRSRARIQKAGKLGPIWGSVIGAIPQCGFSAAASYFYVGKVITLGTLISIYLSTSDEMLPIFFSEKVPAKTILSILLTKIIIGMISGFVVELALGWLAKRRRIPQDYTGQLHDGCGCVSDLLLESVRKTIKVTFFIFLVSLVINLVVSAIGHEAITHLFHGIPVVGELIAALIGLIPNCAASVVVTQLYVEGVIGAGPMMSGLLSSAGVGLLVLFGENHHVKQNLMVLGVLYLVAVFWGILIEFLGIVF